jgi:hypothetical protein
MKIYKLIELIAALILSAILFPLALIFNLFQLKKGSVFSTCFYVASEIIFIIFDTFEYLAVVIDKLGNLILGPVFIRIFVKDEYKYETLFNKVQVTISASLGHAYENIYLNKAGVKFHNFIDLIFGKDHCKHAYKWYLIKKEFNNNNLTGIS